MPAEISIPPDENEPGGFYSNALDRISIIMAVLAIAALVALYVRNRPLALGFLVGSVIALLNFQILKRTVAAIADRTIQTQSPHAAKRPFLGFMTRYALVGVIAYVMIKRSPGSVYGLLAGLFLPVAAILCEAIVETVAWTVKRDR